jgi:hypothetical protein
LSPGVLLHRDLSTNTQLGMLIGVVNAMTGLLLNPEREAETIPGKHLMPGEAKIAAENTFTHACERIDSIVADSRRWGIEYQFAAEAQYVELIKAQTAAEEARRNTAAEIITPHFRFKPRVTRLEDDTWLAYLGDPANLDAALCGIGSNPQAALHAFDEAFSGNLSPEMIQRLKQRENELDGETAPPEKDKHEDKLDIERSEGTEDPAGTGDTHVGNS